MRSEASAGVEPAGIVELDEEEAAAAFDAVARRQMGMSGEEFLARWDAGEYEGIDLDSVPGLVDVWMILPFVR